MSKFDCLMRSLPGILWIRFHHHDFLFSGGDDEVMSAVFSSVGRIDNIVTIILLHDF